MSIWRASVTNVGLREENRRRTSDAIVETAGHLIRTTGSADFTMPAVAEASGISLRTLYRYFPTRDALVAEVALLADQSIALDVPETIDDLERWIHRAWTNLLDDEQLLRAQHGSEAGRALRRSRSRRHRDATDAVVRRLAPELPADRRATVVDAALLVCSSTAMFEYLDVLGLDLERAAAVSAGIVRSMIEQASR